MKIRLPIGTCAPWLDGDASLGEWEALQTLRLRQVKRKMAGGSVQLHEQNVRLSSA